MTAVTYPGVGRYHPTIMMYSYDSGINFRIENSSIEAELCRHIFFKRHDPKVLVDGNEMTQGSVQGSMTISNSECQVMPRAKISLVDNILTAISNI